MAKRLFLVCGTFRERDFIARARNIHPREIRLVQGFHDITGCRNGELIIGMTGTCDDLNDIIAYARTHGIKVP